MFKPCFMWAQTWIDLSGWRWNGTGCFDCWSRTCNLSIQRRASKLHIHCQQCRTVFLLKSWSSKSQFCSTWVKSCIMFFGVYSCLCQRKVNWEILRVCIRVRVTMKHSKRGLFVLSWFCFPKNEKRICVLSPRSLGSMERSNTFETSSSHSSSRHWVCRSENIIAS